MQFVFHFIIKSDEQPDEGVTYNGDNETIIGQKIGRKEFCSLVPFKVLFNQMRCIHKVLQRVNSILPSFLVPIQRLK